MLQRGKLLLLKVPLFFSLSIGAQIFGFAISLSSYNEFTLSLTPPQVIGLFVGGVAY